MLSDYEGLYVLAPDDLVNGEASWNKENGAKSIWYDKVGQNWRIGAVGNRGSSTSDLFTTKGTAEDALPYEIKPWMNRMGGKQTQPDEIVVEGRIKIFSLNLRIIDLKCYNF